MKHMGTKTDIKSKRSESVVPVRDDVHRALKLRSAFRNRGMKELADEVLRTSLAEEIKQLAEVGQ